MVDIVRFNVGVETLLTDNKHLYANIFPKENTFKLRGETIERHMATVFDKFETIHEKALNSVKPKFLFDSVTKPVRYFNHLNATQAVLRANLQPKSKTERKKKKIFNRASRLLSQLQNDTHLFNMYIAAYVPG